MDSLPTHVPSHLPRCLALVHAAPVMPFEKRGLDSVAFRLSSQSGQDQARALGHPLRELNPDYTGGQFVSPLLLAFVNEPQATPIFDSDIHGYHGEMECSAKIRGAGFPEVYGCTACSGNLFEVTVQFDYGGACHDLVEDEPDLPVEDYFQNILLRGRCVGCGRESDILDMDL